MDGLKIENIDTSHIDLIDTYYKTGNPSSSKPIPITPQRPEIFSATLWMGLCLSALVIAGLLGVTRLYMKDVAGVSLGHKTIFLSPVKYFGDISYYDYEQLKNKKFPVVIGQNHSIVAVNFKKETSLADTGLSFWAKGDTGTERVAIIFKDAYSTSNANRDDVILTSILSRHIWQPFRIELNRLYLPFDKSKVTQVRFDTSSFLTQNRPGALVYIKNISIE